MSFPLQQSLDYLDKLPETLYTAVVIHHHGNLQQRCLGILAWRESLLQGALPDSDKIDWPLQPDRSILLEKLAASQLVPYCNNHVPRTEQLLLDILGWLKGEIEDFPQVSNQQEDSESTTQNKNDKAQQQQGHKPPEQPTSDNETQLSPELSVSSDQPQPEEQLDWQQQAQRLNTIDELMKDYAVVRQLGWDFSKGLLARTGWTDILKIHKSLKQASYLKHIIALIGRKDTQNADIAGNMEHQQQARLHQHQQKQRHFTKHFPMQASGITRSDDISRMLASELSALGHPVLKRLWHARRAEATLLSYQYEGVLSEHLPVFETTNFTEAARGQQELETRGAMIIALDTSASMKGQPEQRAKAIVLEVMRVASKEQRACYLLAFSGPGEIAEYELSHSEQGWSAILDIIAQSFHGGTDVSQVINRACDLVNTKTWQSADLLLISDSRFRVTDELVDYVASIKSTTGLRLHGINVSNWNSLEMERLCQPVYRINKV